MSDFKLNAPPLVDGGAAGSAGPSADGNVISLAGTVIMTALLPSAEELLVLNRLQPEVQDRITALQAKNEQLRRENERLREAWKLLRAEIERLRDELRQINLWSQNSMSSNEACERIARAALRREETNVHG